MNNHQDKTNPWKTMTFDKKHNDPNTLIETRKADSKHGKWSETEKTHTFSWRFEKKWCKNGDWDVWHGVFGLDSVEREMGKTVNSHKNLRENTEKKI